MILSSTCTQLRVMLKRREFQFAFLIMIGYACFSFVFNLVDVWGTDVSQIKDASQYFCFWAVSKTWPYFSFLYPFLVVLPCSTSYIDDYRNQLLPVYFSRSSRRNYYLSKVAACFIGTALIIMAAGLVSLILCNVFFPHNNNTFFGEYQRSNYYRMVLGMNLSYRAIHYKMPFFRVFLANPSLYNLLLLTIFSMFSGLLAAFTVSLSFVFRTKKIILFVPIFVVTKILEVCDASIWSAAMEGNGGVYINLDLFDYVLPTLSKGQSILFFLFAIAAFVIATLCFTKFGIKHDIESVQ